jgi:hypothetical protein
MKFTYNQDEGLYTGEQALRLTALSYLKEALVKEQYEECAELIAVAKRFGASGRDVKVEIARALRRLKGIKQETPAPRILRKRF